ncbi:glycoside hydrolase family 3 C-terminal domain-containing protein [Neorhizobium sp. JUb45]|uniref:glycoside hydrolase family 3 C-terminal domain-containing protein n=1 Tax=Neorhizobium sp. JUb45 TaxID=2485113 RepID=UPI0010502DEF|nr:glycoside hydrolase family 3 C-terminal domain-containing protein [Neorhizobium sp. JUb45]TCQ97321.1 beta-glucosidase [Neorhizobium sp. JUb45]
MNEHVSSQKGTIRSIEEALALTTGVDYWTTLDAPAHGIRSLRFADGPHGLRVQDDENPDHLGLERSAPASCFPPAVTLASSWDMELTAAVGEALGREARKAGVDVVLGPGLNIKRSPLCGRNFEYYSEDPFLAGMLAGASARGIQAQGVAACLKHFAANNQETDRLRVSANVDERTLREVYLRAFQIALRESGAWSVMSSYNRINGLHASENPWLLTEILRDEWGFDGVVVSDWGAVRDPVEALTAGLDVRMPGRQDDLRVRDAFVKGDLDEKIVARTTERLRLLADRTANHGDTDAIDYDAHHQLVRKAASESAVLLTNDGSLPLLLSSGLRVAVVGELARTPRYQGAGSSRVNAVRVVSGLDALSARAKEAGASLEFEPGYSLSKGVDTAVMIENAVNLAKRSDVVVIFLGLPGEYEAEGRDRTNIDLPADQLALVEALRAAGKTMVVAMSNGSAVTTAAWRGSVNAIVEFWLTGQAHGDSIADVLLGDTNPGGKLAETIPLVLEDTPSYLNFPGAYENVTYGEGIHVGYRYYDARKMAVDYPFGHGLSYTTFDYSDLELKVRPLADQIAFDAKLTVRNTGPRHGSEVVQLYVHDHSDVVITPPVELRGWKKVRLAPGEAVTIEIAVPREELRHWHEGTKSWIFPGAAVTVHVGASSRDFRLEGTVEIPGEALIISLNAWSTLGEWLDHPRLGPRLLGLFDARGGVKGRVGDLLADEAGQDSVRGIPLGTIADFPGVPLEMSDIEDLCDQAA